MEESKTEKTENICGKCQYFSRFVGQDRYDNCSYYFSRQTQFEDKACKEFRIKKEG